MLETLETGTEFYYANRNTGKAEKCTLIDVRFQFPLKLIAKKETGEIFTCYKDFGCFDNEADAIADALVKKDRTIY